MFKNLVILMLSFIILYLTNPRHEKFVEYYGKRVERQQEEGDWKDKIVMGSKKLNAMMNVKREDKVIFSIYTVEFMGERERYLGILTTFIDITKAEEKAGELMDEDEDKREE